MNDIDLFDLARDQAFSVVLLLSAVVYFDRRLKKQEQKTEALQTKFDKANFDLGKLTGEHELSKSIRDDIKLILAELRTKA